MMDWLEKIITENQKMALFLPAFVLFYVSARFQSLPICTYKFSVGYSDFVYTGLPQSLYLVGAIIAAVGGGIIYYLIDQAETEDKNNESEKTAKDVLQEQISDNRLGKTLLVTVLSVGYVILFILSIVASGLRLCHGDLTIIGIFMVYVVLFVLGNAEKLFT
ncbi:hypothetical protein KU306_02485 [Haloferax larsenii]|uniref:Uncharacterized protein n=1 Tax=Haloferax larsenii TaxID=302484 RepID=A0ABY5RGS9_HALLR|nr:hypothetical protein [Haloferax larsenii]UVE50777.1 hypothetical protein KU306_02485 [Haloferax larsenii]